MGEANLSVLLKNISPSLADSEYVFCTISEEQFSSSELVPLCMFREKEGVTVIVRKSEADEKQLSYNGTWAWITCEVNSDLAAVGFMAAMSNRLAQAQIPTNPVSAFYHDHIFVPFDKAETSMRLLQGLSEQ